MSFPAAQVATAVAACQHWGLRTRYVGKIGADDAAAIHRAEFERLGVETHLLAAPGRASQQAVILVDDAAPNCPLEARQPVDPAPRRVPCEWITNARALHLDGHDTTAAVTAAGWARDARVPGPACGRYCGCSVMSVKVKRAGIGDPFAPQLFGEQGQPVVALPEDSSLAGVIHQDDRLLAGATRCGEEMSLHAQPLELGAMNRRRVVVADLADVASAQAPVLAGCDCGRDLAAGKDIGRTKFDFRSSSG